MGSSLTVNPAANIPREVSRKGKLVIVNLQATPLDKQACLRINGKCEDVITRLVEKMELRVREFILGRIINFKVSLKKEWEFRGIDSRNVPYSFFKKVLVVSKGKQKLV